MNDREITIEEENDVLKTADRLCELIKSSAEFNEYRDALEALKADDNLYKQVEEIRKNNFFAHNGSYGKMSYDEYCNVYNARINWQEDFLMRNLILQEWCRKLTIR